ncbi:hypothetical protein BO71DRAFT_478903 [Aspergillus ellipticus CBS 707.79]|uniref:TLDc domain-containing protein n=1 Tax=Aspergillus ellipticus CBS 707.79 TaxID=1448320 RepID=A0A319DQY6_9EURO|nr:hypothetical protein BO71DRAFT_478903 [Aspergillus ellipticus CBS 707.79]
MLQALDKFITNVQFGPHERKVKEYLDGGTQESIQQDLHSILKPKLTQETHNLNPSTIFDASCIEDADRQRYWTQNSLSTHIHRTHPTTHISPSTLTLLWKCFTFYAHHPFPPPPTTNATKLDATGFERALALLVHQWTSLLGTQEDGDCFWRHDEEFFHRGSVARLLRSIGHQCPSPEGIDIPPSVAPQDGIPSVLDDVIDVLATTQPYSVNLAPSLIQLEATGRKVLRGSTGGESKSTQYRVSRGEVSDLMGLLLRMRLQRKKWGRRFHFGGFDEADKHGEALAGAIAGWLVGGEDAASEEVWGTVMDALPNLLLRFHQLWAVLFRLPMPEVEGEGDAGEEVSPSILAAVSLFAPIPELYDFAQARSAHDLRIAFRPVGSTSCLTFSDVVKALENEQNPQLILATNATSPGSSAMIVGAFIPSSPSAMDNINRRTIGETHLLFQLQPEFRILKWTNPHSLLTSLINSTDETGPAEVETTSAEVSKKPYYIGEMGKQSARLHVDPEASTVTLYGSICEESSAAGYTYVTSHGNEDEDWEVAVEPSKMHVLSVV